MGHKLKKKCVDSRVNAHDLASTGVPFTLTTVQVPNLAITHTKRITVRVASRLLIAEMEKDGDDGGKPRQ